MRLDIEALAYMASSTQVHFGPFIDHLLSLFREERPLLEARGTLIVRQLCDLLDARVLVEDVHAATVEAAARLRQPVPLAAPVWPRCRTPRPRLGPVVDRDHAGPAEADVVLQRDLRALDLALPALAAQLAREFETLREPGRA